MHAMHPVHTQPSRLTMLGIATATAVVLAGCDNDPTENASHATVQEPAQASEAVPPAADDAARVTYAFDNSNSKLEFVGAKVTGKHDGAIDTFAGTVVVVDNALEQSTVSVEADAASIRADQEKLTNHLRSPDFFDVPQFPKVKFTSTSIRSGGEGDATHTVTGNLEMHGVTKTITFPASLRLTDSGAEADAEFGVNRKDWGIVYPGMPDDLIKDEVLLKLTIRATRT